MAKGKKGKKTGSNHKAGSSKENSNSQNGDDLVEEIPHIEENNTDVSKPTKEADINPETEAKDPSPSIPEESDKIGKVEDSKNDDDDDAISSEAPPEIMDSPSLTNASEDAGFVVEQGAIEASGGKDFSDDEEFGAETITEENGTGIDDDDDDFGSFDEASFEEYEQATVSPDEPQSSLVESSYDTKITPEKISRTLEFLFPDPPTDESDAPDSLLSEKAAGHYNDLSRKPHLQPPNWTKSKLRHNLLLKLGIPINLDELVNSSSAGSSKSEAPRKKSISESDLDWSKFNIPDIDSLNLTQEAQSEFLENTTDVISRIETENMSNTSELYLQKLSPEDLEKKLSQLKSNRDQLLSLSTLWHERIEDLKGSQNVFESVVQSMVGYNQKIQRNELLESLRRSKTKRGKKTF